MIALRPFSALMMLLAGVAAGLVDGVIAATTPTGRAISINAARRVLRDHADDCAPCRSRNRPSVLRWFLRDLVVDVADAGVAHREFGELAVARRLDDRPAGGGDQLVDPRLVVGVRARPARRARARPARRPTDDARTRAPSRASAAQSIGLDAGIFDQLRPLRQLGIDHRAELLGCRRRLLRCPAPAASP